MASRMRWSMAVSSARCCCGRELVDVEQRHRAAGDLFGAAERIAVERLEQRRRIERGRDADRHRNRSPCSAPDPANRSLESVKLSPLAIGRTVRRVITCVAGFTFIAKLRSLTKPPGPATRTLTVAGPAPVAVERHGHRGRAAWHADGASCPRLRRPSTVPSPLTVTA